MTITDATLEAQQQRIDLARTLMLEAECAQAAGIAHAKARELARPIRYDAGSIDRYIAEAFHHGARGELAFSQARSLYERAAQVLVGGV